MNAMRLYRGAIGDDGEQGEPARCAAVTSVFLSAAMRWCRHVLATHDGGGRAAITTGVVRAYASASTPPPDLDDSVADAMQPLR